MERVRLLLIFLLALPGTAAMADRHALDSPTKQWRDGPVRYLLTKPESQAFKRLRDDASRARFVAAFWQRRDPTPETDRNEFHEAFWDRVDRTESLRFYFQPTKPLWLTDLGKWYILLGPPHEEQHDQVSTSTRDTVVWTYRDVPGVVESHFSLAFVADETGELRLTGSPSIVQSTVRGLAPHTPEQLKGVTGAQSPQAAPGANLMFRDADAVLASAGGPTGTSALGRATRTGELGVQSLVPPLQTEVTAAASFDALPLLVRTDFYRADDGTTYAAFTLGGGDGGTAGAELAPFGGIVSLDDPAVTYSLSRADQFAAAGTDAPGTFQTGLGLEPGRYRALFGIEERGTGRVGTWKADLTVPDLRAPGLSLSSLTLARCLSPLGEAPPKSRFKVPFILGTLRVVPRTDATLRNGDEFHLYYQVYGATARDGGEPLLDVSYRFEEMAGEEWQVLGAAVEQEGLSGAAQAWSFPVQGWPPGSFRLSVTVTDRTSGDSTVGSLDFQIVD